jgi:hypothetical protein
MAQHALFTGPISGVVEVDGEVYDVTPAWVYFDSAELALKVSDAIGARHQAEGHPDFLRDPEADDHGFVFTPSTPRVPRKTTRKKG